MRFVTLGPAGTNHEWVTRRYLALRGLADADITLVDDFTDGLRALAAGEADYLLQVAVHPVCADVVARAHFEFDLHIVDTFISPSRPLALLARSDVDRPRTVGLQPATASYADLSEFDRQVSLPSIRAVADALVDGTVDAGITALSEMDAHPGRLRVLAELGSVDDPWIVIGRQRVCVEGPVIWPESPGAPGRG